MLITVQTNVHFPIDLIDDVLKIVVQGGNTHAQVLDLDVMRLDSALIPADLAVQIGCDRTIDARAVLMLVVMDDVWVVVLVLVLILVLVPVIWRITRGSLSLFVLIVFTLGGCGRGNCVVVSGWLLDSYCVGVSIIVGIGIRSVDFVEEISIFVSTRLAGGYCSCVVVVISRLGVGTGT